MYPHRSQREWEVSHRIVVPQLSHSMPSMGRILPVAGYAEVEARFAWASSSVSAAASAAGPYAGWSRS